MVGGAQEGGTLGCSSSSRQQQQIAMDAGGAGCAGGPCYCTHLPAAATGHTEACQSYCNSQHTERTWPEWRGTGSSGHLFCVLSSTGSTTSSSSTSGGCGSRSCCNDSSRLGRHCHGTARGRQSSFSVWFPLWLAGWLAGRSTDQLLRVWICVCAVLCRAVVSALAASGLPALVMARGHRIEQVGLYLGVVNLFSWVGGEGRCWQGCGACVGVGGGGRQEIS